MENDNIWFLLEKDQKLFWMPKVEGEEQVVASFETLGMKWVAHSRWNPPLEEECIIDDDDVGCDA